MKENGRHFVFFKVFVIHCIVFILIYMVFVKYQAFHVFVGFAGFTAVCKWYANGSRRYANGTRFGAAVRRWYANGSRRYANGTRYVGVSGFWWFGRRSNTARQGWSLRVSEQGRGPLSRVAGPVSSFFVIVVGCCLSRLAYYSLRRS